MPRSFTSRDLQRGWRTLATYALLGVAIALIASLLQPLRYASTIRLLVLQDAGAVDAYTASRSVERLSENFSTVIYTTAFFQEVIQAGFEIEQGYFSSKEYKRRREWSRMVSATVTRGSGLLTVRVFHPDVAQAEQIVNAIAFVLRRDAQEYAPGSRVDVRLVDSALNSRYPVRPNLFANAFSGLVLGGLLGAGRVLLHAERVRRRHQLVEA